MYSIPQFGSFATPRQTQAIATPIVQLIPPWRGPAGNPPLLYAVVNGTPNWWVPGAVTHVTRLEYLTGTTAHTPAILRPVNWTTVNGAVAAAATVINLTADPGVYSTNYRYRLPPNQTGPAGVADNALGTTDYLACQLVDGSWYVSKVSSLSTLAITMATAVPNVTGGGIADGTPIFMFAAGLTSNVPTDKDPATGMNPPSWDTEAAGSGVASQVFQSTTDDGLVAALNPGDPLLVYSANATAAAFLGLVSGFYGKF